MLRNLTHAGIKEPVFCCGVFGCSGVSGVFFTVLLKEELQRLVIRIVIMPCRQWYRIACLYTIIVQTSISYCHVIFIGKSLGTDAYPQSMIRTLGLLPSQPLHHPGISDGF